MKNIGVFAGTFDPIHNGHLAFAREALSQGLEKVYFLPEPRPRRKQGVRALEHRIAMVNLAIKHEKKLGSIKLEQARFTPHETLPVLQERFKGRQLVLLFGDDVIKHIADWPHIAEIVNNVTLMVAVRHHNQQKLVEAFRILRDTNGLAFRYQLVEPGQFAISSSRVRSDLRTDSHSPAVTPEILGYIHSQRLYRRIS